MLNVWANIAFGIQYRTNVTSTAAAVQKKATCCQSFIAVLHEIIGYAKYRYQHCRKNGGNADGTGSDSDIHGGVADEAPQQSGNNNGDTGGSQQNCGG